MSFYDGENNHELAQELSSYPMLRCLDAEDEVLVIDVIKVMHQTNIACFFSVPRLLKNFEIWFGHLTNLPVFTDSADPLLKALDKFFS